MAITLVALGSNRCHGRHGRPADVVRAALIELALLAPVAQASPILDTAPIGPGSRRYANAVAALDWPGSLPDLLRALKALERRFGRRAARRWGDRVLDLDILAAGATVVQVPGLNVPHPRLAQRRFVLDPLVTVAPGWRHPIHNLTARQLRARALRPKGLPRA
ncbi:2-amino-4-hydroxy-6-hydroxymethyldihydropteridine diphosphokinase [Sandarakinorhabdus sp. AAP62]|uniref:2-amino-4-hydroxy-6- hydroxymethyldihydropteridine diphosphokinase n=1 Tax=Sandarakinorhabdus sp. AAP62 TaxID=1248916 RepID=UPI0003025142|nr:2-amino-4-hydroxy-6-hydroxymethyldihydropteridine diphosphokinase [Sandarakinorhabdus sp. AAP62]